MGLNLCVIPWFQPYVTSLCCTLASAFNQSVVVGFKEQIYDVYRYLPPATQVVLLSATLPHDILEMTSKFMTDPIRILVKRYVFPTWSFGRMAAVEITGPLVAHRPDFLCVCKLILCLQIHPVNLQECRRDFIVKYFLADRCCTFHTRFTAFFEYFMSNPRKAKLREYSQIVNIEVRATLFKYLFWYDLAVEVALWTYV